MSHFVVIAICKKPRKKAFGDEDFNAQITKLFEPYDENKTVPEYEVDCGCIGWEAKRFARDEAPNELGYTIDDKRKEFNDANPANYATMTEDDEEARDKMWREFIKPYTDALERLELNHPMYGKPDPNCEECNGTGKHMSTYNPKSKWDWYTIGGRWMGCLNPDYDPEKDPRNFSKCDMCNGTGDRPEWVTRDAEGNRVFKDKWAEECNGCNVCHGTGTQRNFFNAPVDNGNFRKVSDLAPDFRPFAFITPDGEWHERAKMGWWAVTTDDKGKDAWEAEWKEVCDKYPDHYAVAVDCHI